MRQRTISDYFWCDPDIADLSQEDKATLLYFLTSPHSNIIGVYQIVWRIAAAQMGWTTDQLMVVVKRLQAMGLIDFTEEGWIWVRIWWKHNSPAGAFSPKLIQNAKKQCDSMPSEWREEFINTLESLKLSGINRVTIGYPYPTDTLLPNTTGIGISNSTTTTLGNGSLEYPQELSIEEKKIIMGSIQELQHLPMEKRQELLDELAATIRTNKIKRGNVPCFHSLVNAVKQGTFKPSCGVAVLKARNVATRNRNQTLAKPKGEITVDPVAQAKGVKNFITNNDVVAMLENRAQINNPHAVLD